MSKYTGLLFSAEEYHVIGPFRFPIYKDLVPGEAKGIEDISRDSSKATYASLKLAQKIAKDQNISVKDAVEMMSKGQMDENSDILYKYADELQDLTEAQISQTQQFADFATLAMRYRGEVMLPGKKQWIKTTDWTDEDTNQIPTKMLAEIYQFMLWERDGWPDKNAVESGN